MLPIPANTSLHFIHLSVATIFTAVLIFVLVMGDALKKRLRQSKFENPYQETILSLMVASTALNEHIDKAVAEFGLSRQQYNILRILKGAKGDGYQCGDIANRMVDRAPDITRRIDALEKQGLVDRARSSEDRRVVITRITEKGLALLEKMSPAMEEFNTYLRARLTKQECQELTALCEKIFDCGD
jgi:DNA-binding MarR family transcriptional regulator